MVPHRVRGFNTKSKPATTSTLRPATTLSILPFPQTAQNGPVFTRRRYIFTPPQPTMTPLTSPRAHKHPLGLPRRRLPTSPRLRHLLLLLQQRPPHPRPPTALQDRPRPSQSRLRGTRQRKDTRSHRRKASRGLRTGQGCHITSQEVGRAARTRESERAVAGGHCAGEGGRNGGCAGAVEQAPG